MARGHSVAHLLGHVGAVECAHEREAAARRVKERGNRAGAIDDRGVGACEECAGCAE